MISHDRLGYVEDGSSQSTVFGKHCKCITQKRTHLERLPPLASQLLLFSHCVLTQHGGQKRSHLQRSCSGNRTRVDNTNKEGIRRLCYSISRAQWVVLLIWKMMINLKFKSQLLLRPENSVNAENNKLWWCVRCLLITERPKTPCHYRYQI